MSEYDADCRPSRDDWLELDESLRVSEIVRYHESLGEEAPESGWKLHALLHCVVENQIALDVGNVAATETKLIRQGLTRHDAVHAIGAVIGADVFDILKNSGTFDPKKYRGRLEKLTAKRWAKGKF